MNRFDNVRQSYSSRAATGISPSGSGKSYAKVLGGALGLLILALILPGWLGAQEQTSRERTVRVRSGQAPNTAVRRIEIKVDDENGTWVHDNGHQLFLSDLVGRGYLGVEMVPLTEELRVHFGVPADAGVMVSRVAPDGPAATAGIQVGDILTAVGNDSVDSPRSLARLIRSRQSGDGAVLEVWRQGRMQKTEVVIGEHPGGVVHIGGDPTKGHVALKVLRPREGGTNEVEVIPLDDLTLEGGKVIQLDQVLLGLKEYFGSEEWLDRNRRLEELDLEATERRMKELERRLEELAAKLKETEQ